MHLGQLAESVKGTDQGSQPCFTQVSCWSNVMSATQASLLAQKKMYGIQPVRRIYG